MANDTPPPKPEFSVSVTAPPGHAAVSTSFPHGDITSKDHSLSVSFLQDGRHNVTFSVGTDVSSIDYDPLMVFEGPKPGETGVPPGDAGTHTLKWTSDKKGILTAGNGKLSLAQGENGIIVGYPGGCSSIGIPSERKAFGWNPGHGWSWFSIAKCPDPCS